MIFSINAGLLSLLTAACLWCLERDQRRGNVAGMLFDGLAIVFSLLTLLSYFESTAQ